MEEGGQFIKNLIKAVCTVKTTQPKRYVTCQLKRREAQFTRSTPPNNGLIKGTICS